MSKTPLPFLMKNLLKTLSLVILQWIGVLSYVNAQEGYIPISISNQTLKDSISLFIYTYVYIDTHNICSSNNIQSQSFTPLSSFDNSAIKKYSHYPYWYRVEIHNPSQQDTVRLSLNIDEKLDSLTVFIIEKAQLKDSIRLGMFIRPHPQSEKRDYPSNHSALIKLPPLAHYTIYAKIENLKHKSFVTPLLFRAEKEAQYFIWELILVYAWNLSFIAILGFMVPITIGSYFQYRHRSYLYYSAYIICHLIFFLKDFFAYDQFYFHIPTIWISIYYRAPISFSANIFYIMFISSFLEMRRDYPHLYKYVKVSVYLYILFLVVERFIIFQNPLLATQIVDIVVVIYTFISLIFLLFIFKILKSYSLVRYILLGSLFYVIGILMMRLSAKTSSIWNNTLFWNQIGILLELIFFWWGLAYKAQFDASEKERFEHENKQLHFEKEIDLARLRNQISQDIHDEIGSGLTKISLNAQLSARLSNLSMEDIKNKFNEIDSYARVLNKQVREVIFAINPEYDNFDDLQAYFKENALDFWSNSTIELVFHFSKAVYNPIVSPKIKRQLYLIFKETQNNIAKHAHAQRVFLTFRLVSPDSYYLEIRDDGCGFNPDELKNFSNGLNNIKQRAKAIGAVCKIMSHFNSGSTIIIEGKLN